MFASSFDRVSRALGGFRRMQSARRTRAALGSLDDRTLRDIGIDRGEIMRVVMDITSEPRDARSAR